jgi:hypothetical protein
MPLLHWLTRNDDIHRAAQAPYRLLEEVSELSCGDPAAGNMLIQGDNLDALKALLPYYAGKVKCIYIDPPYNTKSAFEHYDDNLEHSQWLSMMYPRIEFCSIIVATIQTLRVSNTEGRRAYTHSENFEPHFAHIPATSPRLERFADGRIKFSFVNLMAFHRPLVIVDEAPKAGTNLSFEMLAALHPACTWNLLQRRIPIRGPAAICCSGHRPPKSGLQR